MSKLIEPRQQPTQCVVCPIRQRALFQVVPVSYIQDAQARRTDQYHLPARRHLYEEGDPPDMAYTLYDGWVMLYRSHSDGARQGLRIALPGDFLGYSRRVSTACTMPRWQSPTRCCAVSSRPVCTR